MEGSELAKIEEKKKGRKKERKGRGRRTSRSRVTRVEDGSKSTSSRERSDHDGVHLVVDDVTLRRIKQNPSVSNSQDASRVLIGSTYRSRLLEIAWVDG